MVGQGRGFTVVVEEAPSEQVVVAQAGAGDRPCGCIVKWLKNNGNVVLVRSSDPIGMLLHCVCPVYIFGTTHHMPTLIQKGLGYTLDVFFFSRK